MPENVTAQGTPTQDYYTAHAPEARTDIPAIHRRGMPLHKPELYDEPVKDELVADEPVVVDDVEGVE